MTKAEVEELHAELTDILAMTMPESAGHRAFDLINTLCAAAAPEDLVGRRVRTKAGNFGTVVAGNLFTVAIDGAPRLTFQRDGFELLEDNDAKS